MGGYELAGGLWDCGLRALRRRLLHPHAPARAGLPADFRARKSRSLKSAAVRHYVPTALQGRGNYVSGHDASVPKASRGFPIVRGL